MNLYIKGRKNTAVIISEEDYASLQESLYLQSIPGMLESIKEATYEPLDEAVVHPKVIW